MNTNRGNLALTEINPNLWVTNQFGERYLRDVNTWSFEKVSAQALFEERFAERLWEDESLHLVVGTDSGLILHYLQSRALPKGSQYVFVELPEVVEAIADFVLPENQDQIQVCTEKNWEECVKKAEISTYIFLDSIKCYTSLAVVSGSVLAYVDLNLFVESDINEKRFHANLNLNNECFYQVQFQNLADFTTPASVLCGQFAGKTACVLGAGPSVDAFLPWIKQHREQVVVLAVSRICERLHQVGVVPDFIFTVDPQDISFYVSRGAFHFEQQATLVFQFHASHLLVGQWQGKKLYLSNRLPFVSDLNVDNQQGTGPTVSHTTIGMAIAMGFEQVLLAGVDLCFSKEGHSHAQGNAERRLGPAMSEAVMTVETNEGKVAATNHGYHAGVEVLQQLGVFAKQQGVRLVNTSPSAVKVDSVDFCPIEALEPGKMLPVGAEQQRAELVPSLSSEQLLSYLNEMAQELENIDGQIDELQQLCRQAKTLVGRFFATETSSTPALRKKIDKLEKKLAKDKYGIYVFAMQYGARKMIRIARFSKQEGSRENTEKYLLQYYSDVSACLSLTRELLATAKTQLSMRRGELDGSCDYQALSKHWSANQTPRRRLFLQARDSEQRQRQFAEQAPECWQAMVNLEQSQWDIDVASMSILLNRRSVESYQSLLGRLQLAYSKHQLDELRLLVDYLDQTDWPQAKAHQHLALGMIAELEGELAVAMTHFQQVIEDPYPRVINEALLHVASLAIQTDQANDLLMALQCLTQLHARYAVPYAEILAVLGFTKEAEAVYEQYLAQYPEDKLALQRYINFLNELGKSMEAAKIESKLSDLQSKRDEDQKSLKMA